MNNKLSIDQYLGTTGVSVDDYRVYMDGGIYESYESDSQGVFIYF